MTTVAPSGFVYTVVKGDSLSGIAAKVHTRLADLLALNHLTASSLILPGMQLQVPAGGSLKSGDPLPGGLAAVERIVEAGQLEQSHLLHATRAALLWRMGRLADAADAYRRALALAGTGTERRFLDQRLAALDTATDPQS